MLAEIDFPLPPFVFFKRKGRQRNMNNPIKIMGGVDNSFFSGSLR
jgi:hypothetical protein